MAAFIGTYRQIPNRVPSSTSTSKLVESCLGNRMQSYLRDIEEHRFRCVALEELVGVGVNEGGTKDERQERHNGWWYRLKIANTSNVKTPRCC